MIPITNIPFQLCKGLGFASSKNAESSSSATFQVYFNITISFVIIFILLFMLSFLNRLFNTLSWTMTEFSMSIHEMQDKHLVDFFLFYISLGAELQLFAD
ncbi:hypothetical protein EE612_018230 [Oryza sativa]|nr:hypothetical protein EE612_018230 [Oryza sativa]